MKEKAMNKKIWLRRKIKNIFGLYDIKDLKKGGNCGLCGEWLPNEIFDKDWPWGLCEKCKKHK